MNPTQIALLRRLADGESHSGASLGQALGISRAAVWKQIQALRASGLEIQGESGAGYRLRAQLELLDAAAIRAALGAAAAHYREIIVAWQLDSTNRLAMETQGELPLAILAERQTAGRGRRGRPWVSPLGAAVYLSVAWPFDAPVHGLSGLSLVVALAVTDALSAACGFEADIKWPNDIQYRGRKLAGILIELAGDPVGPCRAVIGIGINCRLPEAAADQIDQPWTDLYQATERVIDRNRLTAAVLARLAEALPRFEQQGFTAFQAAWQRRDALQGRMVTLQLGDRPCVGAVLGVNAMGELCLRTEDGEHSFAAGEVTVRVQG